uniref:Secreted protein n=1 Tax=Felis catus TaxID=9685 RepID=A0ABI7WH89_FELCA
MEAVVFVFSLLDCCALIFLSVYFIITLSDLECDYINARSCCSKLNKLLHGRTFRAPAQCRYSESKLGGGHLAEEGRPRKHRAWLKGRKASRGKRSVAS